MFCAFRNFPTLCRATSLSLWVMVLMFAQGCAQVAVDEGEQDVGPVAEEIDEAALDQALNRMIQELESSLEAAEIEADETAVGPDGRYLVKSGDYLDKIIKNTVGDSPLRRDILRDAFVRANPHAFMRSNPNWLLANKRLRVPELEDIKKVIFTEDSMRQRKARAGENPYQGWIQYP